jgi:hypothetical protein
LRRDSDLLIDQPRAIDNRVLIKGPLSNLVEATMKCVATALREVA